MKTIQEIKDNPLKLMLMCDLVFGMCGKQLDGTKSNKDVVYNANIIVGIKKVWYGDFHKRDEWKLRDFSRLLEENVYVLREMDGRFDNEQNPKIEKFVFAYDKEGRELKHEKSTSNT